MSSLSCRVTSSHARLPPFPPKTASTFPPTRRWKSNFIYRLDRAGKLSQLAAISSSSIYGCRVGNYLFFSTMVEPSEANRDRFVRIYGAPTQHADQWQALLSWEKDRWPMRFFQYGNALLPDGNNTTSYLAVTTVAVESEDMVMSLLFGESLMQSAAS